MQETPQQYTERLLGYVGSKKPLAIMAATPKKLARLLKGKSRAVLSKRPAPDKWSVTEILAHMADAEMSFGFRMRLTLGANGTPIKAFDQDVWAGFSKYQKQEPKLSFEAYRILRERNVRLLRSIPKELWDNYGMHEERGKETVVRISEMAAGHDLNHVRQIESILRKGKGR